MLTLSLNYHFIGGNSPSRFFILEDFSSAFLPNGPIIITLNFKVP